ncbi:MAG: LytTR family DNA-binding domain-containing protein [Bacteroidetes bacterium]|nr:LytTR family DNA-binding domain-containing protein [Bacteroidota bacterium]
MDNSKFNSIIIDDEDLAREDLKAILSEFDCINLVGEFRGIKEIENKLERLKPDLIFLDIKLKGESGFDLLKKVDSKCNIIFVTAYDEYAVKAFDVNALDYLLKPVNPDRLRNSLERIADRNNNPESSTQLFDYQDSIFVLFNNHYEFIKIEKIMVISSADDYTEIITSNMKKGLIQKTMKEWETRLPKSKFIRIHRSTIINLDFIEKVEEWFNYSYRIYIRRISDPYVMSRRYTLKNKNLFK